MTSNPKSFFVSTLAIFIAGTFLTPLPVAAQRGDTSLPEGETLRVLNPRDASSTTTRDILHVLGRTKPDAKVTVGGVEASLFSTGIFVRDNVPLKMGDNTIKVVVTDAAGRALYFSRAPIPFRRDPREPGDDLYRQHLGIYAYSRDALARWVAALPSPAELAERLEQLRALHLGLSIGVAALTEAALPGIDTGDDLRRAEAHWHAFQG